MGRMANRVWMKRCLTCVLLLLLLSPAAYLFWSAHDQPQLGLFQDDGFYLIAAKALVEGHGYKILSLPGEPYQTKYPPLYPLLLSMAWCVSRSLPHTFATVTFINWLLYLGYLAAGYMLFDTLKLPKLARWLSLLIVVLTPACVFFGFQIMAESLFSGLVLVCLCLTERTLTFKRPVLIAVGSGLIAGAAFLTKTAAAPLLITTPFVFLYRKQYTYAACFLLSAMPLAVAWITWSTCHRIPSTDPVWLYYTDYVAFYKANVAWNEVPKLITTNLSLLIASVGKAVLCMLTLNYKYTPEISVVGGFAMFGVIRLLAANRAIHIMAFALAYVLELLVWNFTPGERFLFPLLPLCIAGFVKEMLYVCKLIRGVRSEMRVQWAVALACTCGVGCMVITLIVSVWNNDVHVVPEFIQNSRIERNRRLAAYEWLRGHVEHAPAFVSYRDTEMYLYTGWHGYRIQPLTKPYYDHNRLGVLATLLRVSQSARLHTARYVVSSADDYELDSILSDRTIREDLLNQNRGLRTVYTTPDVRVYSVD